MPANSLFIGGHPHFLQVNYPPDLKWTLQLENVLKQGFVLFLLLFTNLAFGFKDIKNNISVSLDVLAWQVREVSDDNWGQILEPTGVHQEIQFLNTPFKWSPGFRVGVGYTSNDKPWDVEFYYTGYKTQGLSHADVNAGEIHSAFSGNFYAENTTGDGISGPYYHHAGIKWDILFNTLDLELHRSLEINRILTLRPFAGLKGAVINQDIKTYWQDPYEPTTTSSPNITPITTFSSATENIRNHFKGMGPSFGLDTTWNLSNTPKQIFNLIGNFSGAILWGQWRLADAYQNNTPIIITTINDSLSTAASMARGYLGVEWEHVFDNAHWKARLGYEAQVWFSQLRYYSFDMGKTNDALYLHGVVLDFCIHF